MVSIETGSFSFTSPPLSSFECNAMASAHIWNAMELIYYRIELTLIFTILPKNGRKSSLWCIIIITFKLYNSIWVWMSDWKWISMMQTEFQWATDYYTIPIRNDNRYVYYSIKHAIWRSERSHRHAVVLCHDLLDLWPHRPAR